MFFHSLFKKSVILGGGDEVELFSENIKKLNIGDLIY